MENQTSKMENMVANNSLFKNIYRNKKVLVTGHTGFKGSWLSLWLNKLGAEVYGYALEPNKPNHYSIINANINSKISDLRDKETLKTFIKNIQPDIIFHLAAQPYVIESYKNPSNTFETNIIGTLNLLEAVRYSKQTKAIVVITTDKVYKNTETDIPHIETDELEGYDPYSSSKACCELVINCYRNSFFNIADFDKSHQTLIASARAGNVIGGGDWGDNRLIPDIITNAVKGTVTKIRNPNAIRPWQHVLEPLSGYLMLGEKLLQKQIAYSGAWNFGPNYKNSLKVSEVAKQLQIYWDKIKFEYQLSDKFHETDILKLNSEKAIKKLKWKPIWTNEENIKNTINWYKKHYEENITISTEQLNLYIKNAIEQNAEWTK